MNKPIESLVQDHFGWKTRDTVPLGGEQQRSRLYRCHLDSDVSESPASIVAKAILGDVAWWRNDCATLAFLDEVAAAPRISPRLLGVDLQEKVYFLEDLGNSVSAKDAFDNRDDNGIPESLVLVGHALARLASVTCGKAALHASHLDRIEAKPYVVDSLGKAGRLRDQLPIVGQALSAFGKAYCPGLDQCLTRAMELYYDGAFQALAHGDCAPVNILLQKGSPVFIDFEFASFRHAFVDLTTWYMFYPLSDDAARTVSESHRDAWTTFPGVANQAREWSEVFAAACTVYGISALSYYLRKGVAATEMVPEEPAKQDILLRFLRRLKMACSSTPAWEPVAASSESLEKGILAARQQPVQSDPPALWA